MEDGIQIPRITPWLAMVLRPVHTVFMSVFFRLKVQGAERIPSKGALILTPTHRSRWDPMVLPWLTYRLLRSMASHDEFVGLQGWFMRNLGAFAVNTHRPSANTLRTCAGILRTDQILVIYPEGMILRLPPNHVHHLKPGTAWLAIKVQREMPDKPIPIFPVRIHYGHYPPRFRTPVEVSVQPPILVTDFLDRPEKQAIRDLTAVIQAGMGDVVETAPEEAALPNDIGSEHRSDAGEPLARKPEP